MLSEALVKPSAEDKTDRREERAPDFTVNRDNREDVLLD
jgi:hypothetical protein